MLRPDVETPGRGSGAGVGETGQASNLKTDGIAHGPLYCQCRINRSGCLVCRRWAKNISGIISGIDARRADSLRQQSMGDLMRAGG